MPKRKAKPKKEDSAKVAEEAHAYTPGLKIKKSTVVRKVRRLPIPGEVLFKVGQEVDFETVVARTMMPGDPNVVKAAYMLGINPEDLEYYLVKKVGDTVEKDEAFVKYKAFFGLVKRNVNSPVDGTIESVSTITGQVIIREKPLPLEVKAYIPGKVVEVQPEVGVVIETNAAFIQGIFGVGGETWGEIKILAESPKDVLSADLISPECKGKVVVGGSLIKRDALKKAVDVGVSGVVVGGIIDVDLIDFMGYEVGVAITGQEDLGLTLIITEGFGSMTMADHTFELLKGLDGQKAAIDGSTQIRAGVIRPEIIVPGAKVIKEVGEELVGGMKPGTPVRVIREPFFGEIATVVSLPVELNKVETESEVRVVEVKLENGEKVVVPRANVEIMEI